MHFLRERVCAHKDDEQSNNGKKNNVASVGRAAIQSPPRSEKPEATDGNTLRIRNGNGKANYSACSLLKSDSIGASKCIGVHGKYREVSAS